MTEVAAAPPAELERQLEQWQLSVVNLPSVEHPDGMNVTVRGLTPIGLALAEDLD